MKLSTSTRSSVLRFAAACVALAVFAAGCTRTVTKSIGGSLPATKSVFDLPPEQFIYVGMDVETLTRLVGEPQRKEAVLAGEIWYYGFGVVMVGDARVKYRYPPSTREGLAAEGSLGVESGAASGEEIAGD
jgi:hypothetical protein